MEYRIWNKRQTVDKQKKTIETTGRIERFEIFMTSVKQPYQIMYSGQILR